MHFYPLHTSLKSCFFRVFFFFGLVLLCSVAWSSGCLLAALHRVSKDMATHFPVTCGPRFLSSPTPRERQWRSHHHVWSGKSKSSRESPPQMFSGLPACQLSYLSIVKTRKIYRRLGWTLGIFPLGESPLNLSLSTSLCRQLLLSF